MLVRGRRDILTTAIFTTAFMAVRPSRGRSQGAALLDLPWKEILTGLGGALQIIEVLGKYLGYIPLPSSSAKPAPICKMSSQDIGALYFRCRTLGVSLDSLNYEPVVENGNGGAIPALIAYQRQPDVQHWRRARERLAQLLLNIQEVLADIARIAGPNMDWSSVGVPMSTGDVQTVTQALNILEPTLVDFDERANGKSRPSADDVKFLLSLLNPLPARTADALREIRLLEQTRQKVTCT